MKIYKLLLVALYFLTIFSLSTSYFFAQTKKIPKSKKKTAGSMVKPAATGGGFGGGFVEVVGETKREPYLGLEPCAKETPEQISELENAADVNSQVQILTKRTGEKDEWIRACAVYRLGEFKENAKDALPVIIKLLRDEQNNSVWTHVEDALWKIPPNPNIPLQQRIEFLKSIDVYTRIYGVYSLGYFKLIPKTHQAEDTLKALIEAAKDDDTTVAWLAVMGIRQLGFYGINTSDAIPVLSELIKGNKLNPIHPVRAIVPMGENAMPAVPLLFDILYNPKKYAGDKDEDNARSYGLYLTTAIALGQIGKPLIPFLEKEIEKEPFAILQVLGNIQGDEVIPILYKAIKNPNPEVRKKALESLPNFTSKGALEAIPILLPLFDDKNKYVAQAAMNKVGNIGKYTKDKTPELKNLIDKKVIPALMQKFNNEEISCYAVLNTADLGDAAEKAIPALVRILKRKTRNYCAEVALYKIGEKGRKFLTKEQLEYQKKNEESDKKLFNPNYNNAKPIKPKTEDSQKTEKEDS